MAKVTLTLEYDHVEDAVLALGGLLQTPAAPPVRVTTGPSAAEVAREAERAIAEPPRISAAVQALLDQHGVPADKVTGTGKNGRITQKDVLACLRTWVRKEPASAAPPPPAPPSEEPGGVSDEGEATPPAGDGTEVTKDAARDALAALNEAKGMNACLDVLSRFGVKRLGELKPETYGDFVAKCREVADGADV